MTQVPVRYVIPVFHRPIDETSEPLWMFQPKDRVQYSIDEIKRAIHLFDREYFKSGTSMVHQFKFLLNNWIFNPYANTTRLPTGYMIKVGNIQNFISEEFIKFRQWSSDVSTYRSEIPHEQFERLFGLNLKLLEAEILFTRNIATNNRMVELIKREIEYLNQHYNHVIGRISEEQGKLVSMEIVNAKEKMYYIAKRYGIRLPGDLQIELCRRERIFEILTAEKQLQDGVTQNVKKVIQCSDLNRYLIGFV